MSEKRLIVRDDDYAWVDTVTDTVIEVEDAFDLVNVLWEENEQLKKDCTVLIYHNQDYRKENEQLKQDLSEYCNFSLHDVLDKKNKEIEQLKADKQALIDFIRKEFPKSHKHILEGFE